MALSIKINSVTYRGTTDYSIKQQGGAVSTTSLKVLLESHPVPLVFQQVQIYIGATLFFAGIIQRVGTPEYSTTYETNVFSIEVSSLECLFNNRLVTKNFYSNTYTSWTQVVQYLFTNYISEENITLGEISTTPATFDSKYSVKDKKLFDVLNEIAAAVGNAAWWIDPATRKFYFRIKTDFDVVTAPTHLTKFKLTEEIGDIRTIEKITGASAGVNGTATNASLLATIAARTGGSGKIEVAETNNDIHSDTKAAAEAGSKLNIFAESNKTITCISDDLVATAIYNSWPISKTINGVLITGDYIVTERTIQDRGPDAFDISVTLKNNNYFARYGYALKKVSSVSNITASLVSDIAADEKLTPIEKIGELARWDAFLAEKTKLDTEADAYSVSRVSFDSAFVALSTYLNAGTAWTSGTPAWFAGEMYTETTDIVPATYDVTWQTFLDAKSLLETAIRAAIKTSADAAIAAAHEATIKLALSVNAISRARNGVLTPAALTASAKYGDTNAAYAGRFEIAHSTDGVTYDVDYGIPNDPAGVTYLNPRLWATGVDGWVANASGPLTIVSGELNVASGQQYAYRTGDYNGKKVYFKYRNGATAQTMAIGYRTTGGVYKLTFATKAAAANEVGLLVATIAEATSHLYLGGPAQQFRAIDIYIGTGAALWYQSSANESSHSHTIPVTSLGSFITNIRARLYKAGGFITIFDEKLSVINADLNAAPLYWGPLITAPTVGIQPNDYYFDSNTVAGGGGKVRYYTGTAWAEMTSSHALWKIVWGNVEVLADAAEWANAQGSIVAAATAIFDKLFASYVIAAYIFAQQIEVPDGGRMRYYNGQGVQKRCVELAEDHIDWIDTPDTTPASDEVLRGRIGRLGVGPTILLDGEFCVSVAESWGVESVIKNAYSYYPNYIELASGEIRIAYERQSDSALVERVWSGTAWGAESVISSNSGNSSYIQLRTGELRIAYQRISDGYLVERVWSGTAWGAESVINGADSTYPDYIELASGELRIAYRKTSNTYLVERVWSGTAWGAESVINNANSSASSYIQLKNGELRIAYHRASDTYIVERVWSGTAWGAESVINNAYSSYPDYVETITGELRVAYYRASDGYIAERIWNGTSWGAASIINDAVSVYPTYIQLSSGELRVAYYRNSDGYLVERTLQRYAQLGAGVIASGIVTGGFWRAWSDGIVEVEQLKSSVAGSYATWTFPNAGTAYQFKSALMPILCGGNSASSAAGNKVIMFGTITDTTVEWSSIVGNTGAYSATSDASHLRARGRWK